MLLIVGPGVPCTTVPGHQKGTQHSRMQGADCSPICAQISGCAIKWHRSSCCTGSRPSYFPQRLRCGWLSGDHSRLGAKGRYAPVGYSRYLLTIKSPFLRNFLHVWYQMQQSQTKSPGSRLTLNLTGQHNAVSVG